MFCRVSILTEVQGKAIIVYGRLVDYRLNQNGELDRLILKEASRFNLPQQPIDLSNMEAIRSDTTLNYFKIPGDQFVVPYSEVKNLNLVFFSTEVKIPANPTPPSNAGATLQT